jgi:CubicO group peptidase (beta-lactamase class C family)
MNERKVSSYLNRHKKDCKISGFSAVLVDEKTGSFIINEGNKNIEDSFNYISSDTNFGIGSATKVFTALLICNAVLENKISLNSTVGDIISESNNNKYLSSITIYELLTHTSGLGRLPDNFLKQENYNQSNPYMNYNEHMLLDFISSGTLENTPGKMLYSNLGYGILGYILERVYEEAFENLLLSIILEPLNMNSTFIYKSGVNLSNYAVGYSTKNNEQPFWDMNVLKAAGGIVSCPNDIKKFLEAIVFKKSPLESLFSVSSSFLNKKMAFGWHRRSLFQRIIWGKNTLWHNGMTSGYSFFIEFNTKKSIGYAIFFNKAIVPDYISTSVGYAIGCFN